MSKLEAMQQPAGVRALPLGSTRVVHFVRHAQALSNIAGEKDHMAYSSEEWLDSALSPAGWKQALALQRHVKAQGLRPQLVVVSPLTRAISTACVAFGDNFSSLEEHTAAQVLMRPMPPAAHPGIIQGPGTAPFLAVELCRETLGIHPCDRRRTATYLRETFPGVDSSDISEEDELWTADSRESLPALMLRATQFVSWLMARPEREMAVVAHSGFLHALVRTLSASNFSIVGDTDNLARQFNNAELRSLVLVDNTSPCAGRDSPTNFVGGQAALDA